ncbi:MAG: aminoacyl-tRNA hydrolase [Phycisphaerales bacterium]|nr:aminoacyl-tRNA hydrolase [Phycisphaerales bacterium]
MEQVPQQPGDELASGSIELAPGVAVQPGAVTFAYSRSGGPGGQNVNKVSTRCELRIDLASIPIHPGARERLAQSAGSRLLENGQIQIVSQSERSQSGNREECFARLRELIVKAMVVPKIRKKTKPGRGAKERRLQSKRVRSETKRRRGGSGDD